MTSVETISVSTENVPHGVGRMLTAKVRDNAMKAQADALNRECVSMMGIAQACGSAPQDNVSTSVR